MRKTWTIVKREFVAFVGTKWFIVGTLFGPFALIVLLALPEVLERAGGDAERAITAVDATGTSTGEEIAAALAPPARETGLRVEIVRSASQTDDETRARLRRRVQRGELDGYVLLPADPSAAEPVLYEGRAAADFETPARIRAAVERAIRRERLASAGIDPEAVERALAPIPFEARSIEMDPGQVGSPDDLLALVFYFNTAMYIVILIYGLTVLRSVQEEKEKHVVELLLSSVRPTQLMTGKVMGIGAAGLLQVAVWVGFGAIVLVWGEDVLLGLGHAAPTFPRVPASLALVLLYFFAAGYFLYAALYAALGAVATSWQEAQNLQFPALIILMVSWLLTFVAIENPDSTVARVGSLVPFTSPLVVPGRVALAEASASELALAAALLLLSCAAMLWLAGAIFRVTILATGSRPTLRQLWRWMRAA